MFCTYKRGVDVLCILTVRAVSTASLLLSSPQRPCNTDAQRLTVPYSGQRCYTFGVQVGVTHGAEEKLRSQPAHRDDGNHRSEHRA